MNGKHTTFGRVWAGFTMLSMVLSMSFSFAPGAYATGGGHDDEPKEEKIKICHATDKGYDNGKKEVDESSILSGHAHDSHSTGGFDGRGDIIPPFGDYLGKNWDAAGQAIWNNECKDDEGGNGHHDNGDENDDEDDHEGKITVDKVVVGNDAVKAKDFKLKVGNEEVDDNKKEEFDAGTYTVTEKAGKNVPTNFVATLQW